MDTHFPLPGEQPMLEVFAAAAKIGFNICEKTAVNWSAVGIRGPKLETITQNGQCLTSMQALRRFFLAANRDQRMVTRLYEEALQDRLLEGIIKLRSGRLAAPDR